MDTPKADTVTVAGRSVQNPAEIIVNYLLRHGGTIAHYDVLAGTLADTITPPAVKATRKISSRISEEQSAWFTRRGASAPWRLVPIDADLRNADPIVEDGLYDAALCLWRHFADDAPKYVGTAKISKVLFLMRPRMYPILDSRLMGLYRSAAAVSARESVAARPDLGPVKRIFWEAIRRDLVASTAGLAALRTHVATTHPDHAETVEQLSDLRLLDMLTWTQS
ncbi:DUF6308 family protein [Aeromicrobium duanguangcaii]|nr:DUF6308 family protein [Aeromicrobium duanguangcaii]MCD9154274.1 DUF6308 family protein [Aeromicrobium duanguangcaii]